MEVREGEGLARRIRRQSCATDELFLVVHGERAAAERARGRVVATGEGEQRGRGGVL